MAMTPIRSDLHRRDRLLVKASMSAASRSMNSAERASGASGLTFDVRAGPCSTSPVGQGTGRALAARAVPAHSIQGSDPAPLRYDVRHSDASVAKWRSGQHPALGRRGGR